jgi:ABC-type multidrug transport system fused ATPase/permease subunit
VAATSWRDVVRVARGHYRSVAVAVALSLVSSGLSMAQPLLVKRVIDSVMAGPVAGWVIPLLVCLFVAQGGVHATSRVVLVRTGEGIVLRIRRSLIDHLLRLRMPAYHQHRTGDLISRAGADSTALRTSIAQGMTDAVAGSFGLVATVAFMIWLDWRLFVITFSAVAVGGAVVWLVLRHVRAASLGTQQATGELAADLERALGAIRTVRASRAEAREARRIGERAGAAYFAGVRMGRLIALIEPASGLAVNGAFLLVLLVGGVRVAGGGSTVGDLVAFLLYLTYLAMPLDSIVQSVTAMQQGAGALQRINEVLALPRESDPPDAHPSPSPHRTSPPDRAGGNGEAGPVLEFRQVWFGYHPNRPVLRGADLRVPASGYVALIGRSGAGKSTVFALTERFFDPDRGVILFGGVDVRDLPRDACRAGIGLVEQDAPVLHGTLRENLLYAAPDAADQLDRVIDLASLGEVVSRLPRGLDTPLGDRGGLLSGGERARVAIARTLLARPRLLLLDEPTAHLDPANEASLRRTIGRLSRECALLVVAHRFATVRDADQIIVLDHGRVVAVGNHERLLEASPYYRGLASGHETRPDDRPVRRVGRAARQA